MRSFSIRNITIFLLSLTADGRTGVELRLPGNPSLRSHSKVALSVAVFCVFVHKSVCCSSHHVYFFFLHSCRLETPAYYYAFLLPALLSIAVNTVLVILCIWYLRVTYQKQVEYAGLVQKEKKDRKQLIGFIGIALLVGVTWLLGIPMFDDARLSFQYIFSILNSFQGVSIFVFQLVLSENVRNAWLESLRSKRTSIKQSSEQGSKSATLSSWVLSTLQRKKHSTQSQHNGHFSWPSSPVSGSSSRLSSGSSDFHLRGSTGTFSGASKSVPANMLLT